MTRGRRVHFGSGGHDNGVFLLRYLHRTFQRAGSTCTGPLEASGQVCPSGRHVARPFSARPKRRPPGAQQLGVTVTREFLARGSILAMLPLITTCIRRPFHWGIVVVADSESGGLIPDVDPETAVSSNEHGIVILIRHAQDIESFEGEFEWAEAEVLVRLLAQQEAHSDGRREVFRGRLATPSGRISIGDVVHPAHKGWNKVIVSVASDVSHGPIAERPGSTLFPAKKVSPRRRDRRCRRPR